MVYDHVIYGKTVDFRSVEERDAKSTLEMRMNPNLNQHLHKIENSLENQIAFIRKQRSTPGDYLFLAEDKKGNPVGMRGILNFDAEKKICETGRLIGQGNAVQNTEIAIFGYDFAFQVLGVESILLTVLEKNTNVLSGHRRYGAVETKREYMDQFQEYLITEVLTRDSYYERRSAIYRLIERLG